MKCHNPKKVKILAVGVKFSVRNKSILITFYLKAALKMSPAQQTRQNWWIGPKNMSPKKYWPSPARTKNLLTRHGQPAVGWASPVACNLLNFKMSEMYFFNQFIFNSLRVPILVSFAPSFYFLSPFPIQSPQFSCLFHFQGTIALLPLFYFKHLFSIITFFLFCFLR